VSIQPKANWSFVSLVSGIAINLDLHSRHFRMLTWWLAWIARREGNGVLCSFEEPSVPEQGKLYRTMERYCYNNGGTFCFSRPVYDDASSVPRWLEFGLLRDDGSLWVEVFEN